MGPDAVEEPNSPPPLGPALAKVLMHMCLASACFGAAAAVEALAFPVLASMADFLSAVLCALAAGLLVKCAGLIDEFTEVSGRPSGSFLQDTAPLVAGALAILAFLLLSVAVSI